MRIEVINEDGMHRVAGMFGPLDDEHPSMFREFPNGLGIGRDECGWGAEQALVPAQRRRIVVDRDAGEQVEGHAAILRDDADCGRADCAHHAEACSKLLRAILATGREATSIHARGGGDGAYRGSV